MKLSDLEDIVSDWKEEFGEETRAKTNGNTYLKIPIRERWQLLVVLIKTIQEQDIAVTREFFKNGSVKSIICSACFPPIEIVKDKDSWRRGIKAFEEDYKLALSKVFKNTIFVEKPEELEKIEEITSQSYYTLDHDAMVPDDLKIDTIEVNDILDGIDFDE